MRPPTTSLRAWTGLLLAGAVWGLAPGAATAQPSAAPTSAAPDSAAPPGAAQAPAPASTRMDADTELLRLRGLEQEPPGDGGAGRAVANALLFLPRTLLDGLLYSGAYGAHVANETSLPQYVSEIASFYHHRIGVRPLINFSTGATFDFGLEVAYRQGPFGAAVSGRYGNGENWGTKLDLVSEFAAKETPLKVQVSAFVNQRDDFEFYGFGPEPRSDPRSHFRPEAQEEFGIYAQRLSRVLLVFGARPLQRWQFFYTGFYQERRIADPTGSDPANLSRTFDTGALPGVGTGKQVYQEASLRWDTRAYERKISPGFRLDAYAGLSVGVSGDATRFNRLGIDTAAYLPIIKRNRLIVPRIIVDTVDNLEESVELSFADYGRQPAFRGAARTQLLRTDEVSAVPSLEYQWPLSHNVSGHLFVDGLLVAPSFGRLSVDAAPYSYGIGIAVQGARSEVGRIAVSTGSEGARFMLTVGLNAHLSDRTRWQ